MANIRPIGDGGLNIKDVLAQQAREINQLRSDLTLTTDTGDKFIMGELLMQPAAFTSLMESVATKTKSPVESLIANYALFQMKNGSSSQVDIEATMNAIMDPASQNLSSLVGQLSNFPASQTAPKILEIKMMQDKIARGDKISSTDIKRLFNSLTKHYSGGVIPPLVLSQTTMTIPVDPTSYQQVINDLSGPQIAASLLAAEKRKHK